MALLIGAALALAAGLFATLTGLDRDRAFYPTVMIVIAVLYCLFAVLGGSTHALVAEAVAGSLFIIAAVLGFRGSLWLVAGALAAHGVFDFVHPAIITNPGVPPYWPAFCGAYDVVAGAYLAWLLSRNRVDQHWRQRP
jgi:hypothetical protein